MPQIKVLEQTTIDRIAAGEVVERPASVVKELVENAIDAGADAITVEIKEGGIDLIRVTDNGCGIEKEQVPHAFLRHATSKIKSAEDLDCLKSLGFRGEALSSIAAVSETEVITKTSEALTGLRYRIKGGGEVQSEEVGAPDGTTFLIRNLFFNVPARKKFLKQAVTEGSYVTDLMEHMALSRPDISIKFTNNGKVRFHTSGKNDLVEVIYRIYGRDTVNALIPLLSVEEDTVPSQGNIGLSGYLGRPQLNRSNRSFEFFFINGRYIKSELLSKALEEGYQSYLMQHKFPFAVIAVEMDTVLMDVNVHPAKMEVRFTDEKKVSMLLSQAVRSSLEKNELITSTKLVNEKNLPPVPMNTPEPFETMRIKKEQCSYPDMVVAEDTGYKVQEKRPEMQDMIGKMQDTIQNLTIGKVIGSNSADSGGRYQGSAQKDINVGPVIKAGNHILVERPVQMDFFDDKFLSQESRSQHRILGQLFGTYWLVALGERLIIIDQHAAHEKVKYEYLLKELAEKSNASQMISPPVILQLSGREEATLQEYLPVFTDMGFEIEAFGEHAYAMRSVPSDLYGCHEAELFRDMLDELSENAVKNPHHDVKASAAGVLAPIRQRIASAACKAAVKGNQTLSMMELEALIEELLTLENPYYCPHGRPTMISMSKYEIEKKFKRIV